MKVEYMPPEYYAREVLSNLRIKSIPTPVTDICDDFGIDIYCRPDLDAEGILVIDNDEYFMIVKNTYASLEPRQRFTIAHELGHFCLPWHQGSFVCNVEEIHTYQTNKRFEREANIFASELLMPEVYFLRDVHSLDMSIMSIIQLSEEYHVSITAAAVRFISKTDDIGALICSVDGQIKWSLRSKNTKWAFRSGNISEHSFAYDFFSKNTRLNGEGKIVRPDAWISTPVFKSNVDVYEHTLSMPNYNQCLTLVKILEDDSDDDDFEW